MRIKPKWFAVIVYAGSTVVLSAVLFLLVTSITPYLLSAYGFTLLAATVLFGTVFYFLSDGKRSFREFPANAPYGYIAIQYLVIECALAAVMWILSEAMWLEIKYFVAAEIVLAVIFGVRFAVAFGAMKYVAGGEHARTADAARWRSLTLELQTLQKRAARGSPEEHALKRLTEAARFSDPLSRPETAVIDAQIEAAVSSIRHELECVNENKLSSQRLSEAATRTERLMEERSMCLRDVKR